MVNVMSKDRAYTNQIKTKWMCYNCFDLWCVGGSRPPLACAWHGEQLYIAGLVPQNGAGGLADEKPWVSMPLSQNGLTMLTPITFLALGLSINVPFMLLTSGFRIKHVQHFLLEN